jgi:hypothetical protein
MSKQERETFLTALRRHSGVDRPDRPPDGAHLVSLRRGVVGSNTEKTSEESVTEQAGHAAVVRARSPYAYVTVEGPVEIEQTDRAARPTSRRATW